MVPHKLAVLVDRHKVLIVGVANVDFGVLFSW